MSMSAERAELKSFLLRERVVSLSYISPRTNKPVVYKGLCCELCAKKYEPGVLGPDHVSGLDMHEVFITRGNVRGNARLLKEITECKFNAALVCNDCNINRADTKWAVDLLAQKLVMRYGEWPITEWIKGLGMKVPTPYIQTVRIAAERISTVEKPQAVLSLGL